ncbi:GNAT family N-acetyltransferase [uncultured Allomuricauda sp.]|uniref:GNAT family N-acetyltransferase n=1 Tax=Allomuricauda sp. R78024 TaxID=3093867 RepID=UPI00260F7AEF|nr:GNAT family N-acetyltransferase [uncultured Allomuricauda sp.]
MNIYFEPVNSSTIDTYILVGKKSYQEHYLHLWENEDSTPYISKSFTKTIVQNELFDPNIENFLVQAEHTTVGIVKLIKNKALDELSSENALLAEKIYLLQAYSGKGLGKMVLQLIESYAKDLNKDVIWLDTMKKGNPINFYLKNGFKIKRESELKLSGAKLSEKEMWVLTKQL